MPGSTPHSHDEIAAILAQSSEEWSLASEIAERVNERGRYEKRDGSAVTAYQIHGRTKKYPMLFERDGAHVRLRARPGPRSAPPPRPARAGWEQSVPDGELVKVAMSALREQRFVVAGAIAQAPTGPGLYAITATPDGRSDLGFDESVSVLYVGKAEDSLASRNLGQHFADEKIR